MKKATSISEFILHNVGLKKVKQKIGDINHHQFSMEEERNRSRNNIV